MHPRQRQWQRTRRQPAGDRAGAVGVRTAARRDLGYSPRISMAAGTAELIASLRAARP